MPRKTIAGLEAEIEQRDKLISDQEHFINSLKEELARHQARPANVYLTYTPSGNPEIDCIYIVDRAIQSLPSLAAQQAIAAWVAKRFEPDDGG